MATIARFGEISFMHALGDAAMDMANAEVLKNTCETVPDLFGYGHATYDAEKGVHTFRELPEREWSTTRTGVPLEIDEETFRKAAEQVQRFIVERDEVMGMLTNSLMLGMATRMAMCIPNRSNALTRERAVRPVEFAPVAPEYDPIPVEDDSVFAPQRVEAEKLALDIN